MIAGGKLRALAVTAPTRMKGFEQVPTLAESGLTDFEWVSVQGLFALGGTPPAVLNRINADVTAVMRQPDISERLQKMGLESVDGTPQQFSAWIAAESTSIKTLIKQANIKIQ